MASRPTLPYFASPDLLPAPLPTVVDILASTQLVKRSPLSTIVRIGEHFLVKHGHDVRLQEGENMLFVQQATSVRVPTVYALFHDNASDQNFIVQEYIPGRTIYRCWESLDTTGKENVVTQLRRYFDELRRLPSPGYFGGIWRQDTINYWLTGNCLDAVTDPLVVQPHDTEEQWVDAMLRRVQARYPTGPRRIKWMSHVYHSVLQNHNPVFTHGDIFAGNILLREDGTVVLIDWENSGWYPSYWEFCVGMVEADFDESDWPEWIPGFLDEYVAELGWIIYYRTWLLWNGA